MRIFIIFFLIVFCGSQLFSRKDLEVKPHPLEKELQHAHKLIRIQHEKLVACQLELELNKIKHEREIKLQKLEINRLSDLTYKLGFLSFVLVCFALYSLKKQQNS